MYKLIILSDGTYTKLDFVKYLFEAIPAYVIRTGLSGESLSNGSVQFLAKNTLAFRVYSKVVNPIELPTLIVSVDNRIVGSYQGIDSINESLDSGELFELLLGTITVPGVTDPTPPPSNEEEIPVVIPPPPVKNNSFNPMLLLALGVGIFVFTKKKAA